MGEAYRKHHGNINEDNSRASVDNYINKNLLAQLRRDPPGRPDGRNGGVESSDLVASMAKRLSVLERDLRERQQLAERLQSDNHSLKSKLRVAEEEIAKRALGVINQNDTAAAAHYKSENTRLRKQVKHAWKQVAELKKFLGDYGMVWIGEHDESESEGDPEVMNNYEEASDVRPFASASSSEGPFLAATDLSAESSAAALLKPMRSSLSLMSSYASSAQQQQQQQQQQPQQQQQQQQQQLQVPHRLAPLEGGGKAAYPPGGPPPPSSSSAGAASTSSVGSKQLPPLRRSISQIETPRQSSTAKTRSASGADNSSAGNPSSASLPQPPPSTQPPKLPFSFELLLERVEELNQVAGDGVSDFVKQNERRAVLSTPDPVSIFVFCDGIQIHKIRPSPFGESSVDAALRDILDGYFPYMLKRDFPNGVPLKVIDCRRDSYLDAAAGVTNVHTFADIDGSSAAAAGLAGAPMSKDKFLNRLPKSVIRNGKVIEIKDGIRGLFEGDSSSSSGRLGSNGKVVVSTPMDAFLSTLQRNHMGPNLPHTDSFSGSINHETPSAPFVFESPQPSQQQQQQQQQEQPAAKTTAATQEQQHQELQVPPFSAPSPSAPPLGPSPPAPQRSARVRQSQSLVGAAADGAATTSLASAAVEDGGRRPNFATLQVKSEDGKNTFILKMGFMDTIGSVRNSIDAHRRKAGGGNSSSSYEIRTAFPARSLTDMSETLEAAGLVPNGTLFLRAV